MSHNPYSPPSSPVADPAPGVPIERPKAVRQAVMMLWIATAIGVATAIYVLVTDPGGGPEMIGALIATVVVLAMTLGISWWIFDAIWRGRNWARIALLVIAIINTLSSLALPMLMEKVGIPMPVMTVFEIVAYVLQFALTVASIVLLFMPASRPWFARRD